jgi:GntR family carbon starvation induced transcriptional regulator
MMHCVDTSGTDIPQECKIMKKPIETLPRVEAEMTAAAATRTTAVYANMRRDIVRGLLLPGEKLRIENLGAHYGVGATPVREALNRLSTEGLVVQQDQKGFRVTPVSIADLLEVTRTRIWVTEIALRESIANGDDAWEEGVLLAYRRLSRNPNRLPEDPGSLNPVWEELHCAFHDALIAACPSRMLLDFSARMFQAGDRYRHLSVRGTPSGERNVNDEHLVLMEATIGRRTEEALRLMSEHTLRTTDALLQFLQKDAGMSRDDGTPVASTKRTKNQG